MDGSEHYRLHVRLVLKENIWLVNGYSRCSKLEQASTHKSAQTHAGCVFCDSGKPIYFGAKRSKVKITSHNTSVSIFKQNAILRLAAYVIHDGFFPAAQATLATPDFPCVTSRRLLLLSTTRDRQTAGVCGVFCSRGTNGQTQPTAKALPSWVFALL